MRRLTLPALLVALAATLAAQTTTVPPVAGIGAAVQVSTLCLGGPFIAAANTTEQTLATCTIPAGRMSTNGQLVAQTWWEFKDGSGNATAGTKAVRTRFSGNQVEGANNTGTAAGYRLYIVNTSASTQFHTGDLLPGGTGASGTFGGLGRTTVNTAVDQPLTFTCQKSTAGENCTLLYYSVQLVLP